MTTEHLKTGIHKALKMQEVPVHKFGSMVARTITGTVLVAVGLGLLYAMVRVYLVSQALSLPLLATGVGFIVVGANIASNQLVVSGIASLATPIKTIKTILKNGNG